MEVEKVLGHAVQRGAVDYDALSQHEADLARALAAIATTDAKRLTGQHRYAFYLNAYNLWALELARRTLANRNRSLANPFTWFTFFVLRRVRVAHQTWNLAALERIGMRRMLRGDARGHFALVCASRGCPPLRDGLYHGESLDAELEMAARAFLREGAGYRLDRNANTILVTPILKWYRRDFRKFGDVHKILARWAPKDDADWIAANRPRVRWMKYNWALNGRQADA